MAVRLVDVAERAGVSVKTVSNVVNQHAHVRAATRDRVEAVIKELGYRPNLSARHLKYGRGGFIALAVPQLDIPYFAELAVRISAAAERRGFIMLLDTTHGDPTNERLVLAGMKSHIIDGVIFSPLALTADEIASRADSVPMVLLGERLVPPGYDHVTTDSVAAAGAVTAHLISLGRKRIGAIGRKPVFGTGSLRLQGYAAALSAAGLPFDPDLSVAVPNYLRLDGYLAMRQLLDLPARPDAVFCFNDLMAIGAIRACHDAGLRVPQDVAIAGFDDIVEGRFASPTLTTISPDLDTLAEESIRLLVNRIEHPQAPAEQVKVSWQLVVRESTSGVATPLHR